MAFLDNLDRKITSLGQGVAERSYGFGKDKRSAENSGKSEKRCFRAAWKRVLPADCTERRRCDSGGGSGCQTAAESGTAGKTAPEAA